MVMEKFPSLSQLAKIVFFLLLLVLIPFISTSLRPSYLYFLLNILILVVGVEAGFLGAMSAPRDEKKPTAVAASPANVEDGYRNTSCGSAIDVDIVHASSASSALGVKKKAGEKARVERIKKCPSRPSLFFISSLEGEEGVKEEEKEEKEVEEEEEEEKEVGEMSKQELYTKAEMFIGNFYMQLKMQRKESWQKIHGLYQKAF
ncbi:uncharacterized protein [Typha latifolia]|uniref:uncharacterized protein n=1 Tax=Typha latifolia TaxID=4733 RepID=UPI003C2C04DF